MCFRSTTGVGSFVSVTRRRGPGTCTPKTNWLSTAVIPYRRNTSEDIRRVLNRFNIRVAFRTTNTIRSKLAKLKDARSKEACSNLIYKIACTQCPATYIGQTGRQLQTRIKEHAKCTQKAPKNSTEIMSLERDSAIALHAISEGHVIDFKNPKILKQGFKSYKQRLVAEALFINAEPTCVNRSDGTELPSIWQATDAPYLTSDRLHVTP